MDIPILDMYVHIYYTPDDYPRETYVTYYTYVLCKLELMTSGTLTFICNSTYVLVYYWLRCDHFVSFQWHFSFFFFLLGAVDHVIA